MNKLVAPSPPRLNLLSWRQNQQLLQWKGWQVRLWLGALLDSLPTGAWLQRWSMVDGSIEVDLILPEQWHQWWE